MTWRQLRLEIARMPEDEQGEPAFFLEAYDREAELYEVALVESDHLHYRDTDAEGKPSVKVGQKVLAPR